MNIEQNPVTGKENTTELTPQMRTLSDFYRALNTRNIELMAKNWVQTNEAVMDNPIGGIKRGWEEIREVYERLFSGSGAYSFEFYDYSYHEADEIFYVVGRERGEYKPGESVLKMAIRTSRVFRRIEGEWRQVHHHGSIDDPGLLAAYQRAVISKE
jgi:ketosteroid isomerase-like protein